MSTALAVQGNGPIQPANRVQLGGASAMQQTIDDLNTIRSFVRDAMKEGLDFGVIPGTGTKPTLLQPGAQKLLMYLNCYPDYEVETHELPDGHVEYIVKTCLKSRASQAMIGSGIGSCSTMEAKYRWRKAGRTCPQCGVEGSIIQGRPEYGGGWVCFGKKGGCGAKFDIDDQSIASQANGRVENPDIYDQRNTVLKMAKKRSLVDSAHGLGCMSELFTQDLEDFAPIHHEPEPGYRSEGVHLSPPSPPPARNRIPQQRRDEPPVNSEPSNHGGIPRTGRALFAWLRDQEQRTGTQLVRHVNEFIKSQGMPARMVDLSPEQVVAVLAELQRQTSGNNDIETTEAGARG